MVYYYASSHSDPPATIYVGKDKFENEELIKFGWDCDFHADNLSSAHIYLRLQLNQQWDTIAKEIIEDCAQLTKANSIEGNKRDNVTIIYTPWSNLKKDGGMATGQVGFHDPRKTRRILVPARTNAIVNRLEKTKTLRSADELPGAKDAYMKEQRRLRRNEAENKKKEEDRQLNELRMEKEEKERAWEALRQGGTGEGLKSNEEGFDEDDFM